MDFNSIVYLVSCLSFMITGLFLGAYLTETKHRRSRRFKLLKIRVKYWQTLIDLDESNTEVPLPQAWHEILLYGAVWRLYRRLGSHALGREMRNAQIDLINSTAAVESKEEEDSQMSGVDIPDALTRI